MNEHASEEVAIKECGSINFLADDTPCCANCGCVNLAWRNLITDLHHSEDTICPKCGAVNQDTIRSVFLAQEQNQLYGRL